MALQKPEDVMAAFHVAVRRRRGATGWHHAAFWMAAKEEEAAVAAAARGEASASRPAEEAARNRCVLLKHVVFTD